MTTDIKGLQEALLHHLSKNDKKHNPEIIKRICKVIDWKRIPLKDKDVDAYVIFNLIREGFEEFITQKECVMDKKTKEICTEECLYLVKLEK